MRPIAKVREQVFDKKTFDKVVELARKPAVIVTGSTSKSSQKYTMGFWALIAVLFAGLAFWRKAIKKS